MITKETNTTVFLVPITLLITNMLGKLRAGPASSSAKAGPCPIPFPIITQLSFSRGKSYFACSILCPFEINTTKTYQTAR